MNFEKIVNDHKEEIINTLQQLLRIPSVLDEAYQEKISGVYNEPFGPNIRKALEYMLSLGEKDGFEVLNDDGFAGVISYKNGNPKESVGILCHLDVVPVGNNWTYPPFEAKIVDGKIYARGSSDDKGPTIACYYALKLIKNAGIKLKKEIQIILGTDEETGWRGINHYLSHYPMPTIGFAPDCDFPLVYGEKGRMSFDLSAQFDENDVIESISGGERYNVVLDHVEAKLKINLEKEFQQYLYDNHLQGSVKNNMYTIEGIAAHAMEPFKGINAGCHMCNFLKSYSSNKMVHFIANYFFEDSFFKKMNLDYNDYEMGPITVNIGIMHISKEKTRVTLDSRFPVRYDVDQFDKTFNEIVKENQINIIHHTYKEPHYICPDDELVIKLYDAYVKNTGDTMHKPFTVGGGTYAGVLKKGVAYGMLFPNEEELAHQKDEYVSIDSLLKAILIYIDAILALGEIDA